MRKVAVFMQGLRAGLLEELSKDHYRFTYEKDYTGEPVSLIMPIKKKIYEYKEFPPFFDGLLPEGAQLSALLRLSKLDENDYLGQLIQIGADLVGAVTIEEI